MKKIYSIAALLLLCGALMAQTTENYLLRYNALTKRVGFAGVGVETLIQKWEKDDPADLNHMVARFNYYLTKSERDTVVINNTANYLGLKPLFQTKDSLGRKVFYYNEPLYDPQYFGKAIAAIDQAISCDNARLDIMILKLEALISYEKTIPDQGKDMLVEMIQRHFTAKTKWDCPGVEVTDENFLNEIHAYCVNYFNIASPQSMEAFKQVSEKVLKYRPKEIAFINNMGAYYVSAKKDDKKALKYYKLSQKLDPEDMVSKQNIALIEKRAAAKAGKGKTGNAQTGDAKTANKK